MILLTLGTQLPFPRLVEALDTVAPDLDEPVFGQIGDSPYRPRHFESVAFLAPQEFRARFDAARVIVGHAGIGTILSGLRAEKPLVLMARRAAQGEHRNDHQLATAAQLGRIPGIHVVEDAASLRACLTNPALPAMKADASPVRDGFITALRQEIFGGKVAPHP